MPTYGPISVTTVGGAGVAVGSTTTPLAFKPGTLIEAIKVDYNASAPATTDLTISEVAGLGRALLTLTDTKTDGTFYPVHATHTPVGGAADLEAPFVIEGALTIALAQCDALTDAVLITFQTISNREEQ